MKAESLDDLHKVFDELDLSLPYPQALADKPRGRAGYAKKVHLPYGWLDSRTTDFEERKQLFGNDPMDASY
jgi:hypothetical protein